MLVKTLRRHGYAKHIHVQGEEYDIKNKKHVYLLEACGKIRRIPEVISAPVKEEPKPIEIKTAPKKKSTPKKKKSRTYKRKDMVAE